MHAAALGGNVDIVKLLLSYGVLLHTTTVVSNPHIYTIVGYMECTLIFMWLSPQTCLQVHIRCVWLAGLCTPEAVYLQCRQLN